MLKQTEVPAISKAIDGLYVMNDNDRLKELARMREKAMHDRASELEEAILTGMERGIVKGRAEGRAERENEIIRKLKMLGLSDSQIKEALKR